MRVVERNGDFLRGFCRAIFRFGSAGFGDADGQEQACGRRQWGEVVGREPEGGFYEVGGERGGIEELGDGFAGEIWCGDFFEDDAGARGAAKRDDDDVAGDEL